MVLLKLFLFTEYIIWLQKRELLYLETIYLKKNDASYFFIIFSLEIVICAFVSGVLVSKLHEENTNMMFNAQGTQEYININQVKLRQHRTMNGGN